MDTSVKNVYTNLLKVVVVVILTFSIYSTSYPQTVTGIQDISFGNIFPGVPNSISKKSANAMEFTITGTVDAEVSLIFTLPEYISTTGANMPIFFFNTNCQIDSTSTGNQASPTYDNLNPFQSLTYSLGPNGKLTLWLGGQVVPRLVQKSGSYTATVRLTATYTGN